MPDSATNPTTALMQEFARRTGLVNGSEPRRYLWTDAFAVCNYLGLARSTGDERCADLARQLIHQVHHVLGRHRSDDPRRGWISGLAEREGENHPTRGGLRIGKPLPERRPNERPNEQLEWERDGQYFHYLTKWMHALDQMARFAGDPGFNLWARELAQTAFAAFTYRSPGEPGRLRMYWKMRIDLSAPAVASMGQHDPLDGYVTALQLRATARQLGTAGEGPDLEMAQTQYLSMVHQQRLTSADPLGIGGLLVDCWRLVRLHDQGEQIEIELPSALLSAAQAGLQSFTARNDLGMPARYRLGFRELGLALGLKAMKLIRSEGAGGLHTELRPALESLSPFLDLEEEIESFWSDSGHRQVRTWNDHRDINEVMLATVLLPDGFLGTGAR